MRRPGTVIVGGGLAGLRLADLMQQAGRDYLLIEARDRLGGRILHHVSEGAAFDLGPAWFWSGQPRMASLVDRFSLEVFEQYATGKFRFENAQGEIAEGFAGGSMQGSLRLNGGMRTLTEALAASLPANRILTDSPVTGVKYADGQVTVKLDNAPDIVSRLVVLALPPRVAAHLAFSPALPAHAMQALVSVPTWMAGQAKALALYDEPFWRANGLSGDAMSHRGPVVEIHDASPLHGGPAALFGFIGIPPDRRRDREGLRRDVAAQFSRLFGPDAPNPRDIIIKDWAADSRTATDADAEPLFNHPRYGRLAALQSLWGDGLHFSGTETASEFGGYLEGALEAADATFQTLTKKALIV